MRIAMKLIKLMMEEVLLIGIHEAITLYFHRITCILNAL